MTTDTRGERTADADQLRERTYVVSFTDLGSNLASSASFRNHEGPTTRGLCGSLGASLPTAFIFFSLFSLPPIMAFPDPEPDEDTMCPGKV